MAGAGTNKHIGVCLLCLAGGRAGCGRAMSEDVGSIWTARCGRVYNLELKIALCHRLSIGFVLGCEANPSSWR